MVGCSYVLTLSLLSTEPRRAWWARGTRIVHVLGWFARARHRWVRIYRDEAETGQVERMGRGFALSVRLSASGRTIDGDARGLLDHQAFLRDVLTARAAVGSFCLQERR